MKEKPEPKQEVVYEDKEDSKDDNEPVSEEGIDQESITLVMDQCKCTKEQAIRALRRHNGDTVNALMVFWVNSGSHKII